MELLNNCKCEKFINFVRDNDIDLYVDQNNKLVIEGIKTNVPSSDMLKYRVNYVGISGDLRCKILLVIPSKGQHYLNNIKNIYLNNVVSPKIKNDKCIGLIEERFNRSNVVIKDITSSLKAEDYFDLINSKNSMYKLTTGESFNLVVYR